MLMENAVERSRAWVKRLPKVLKAMNSQPRRITGKEPDNAIKLKEIDVKKVKNYNRPVGLDEMRLPPEVRVRYLYSPGEYEGDDKRRATDSIWSMGIYDISRSVMTADQPIISQTHLQGDLSLERSFKFSVRIQSCHLILC